MNDFKIKLNTYIDFNEIKAQLLKIESIKIKLNFDLSGLESQLKSIVSKYNVGGALSQSATAQTTSVGAFGLPASSSIKQGISTVTTLNEESVAIKQVVTGYDELGKKIKETYTVAEDGSWQRQQSTQEEGVLLNRNIQSYDDLSHRVKQLSADGKLTAKQTADFTNRLNQAKESSDEFAKQKVFKQIGQDISDAGKHAMGFGEMLKTAYQKFSIWSVATVSWYGVIKVIRRLVTEVYNLDTAFTKIQMVTQSSNESIEALKKEYIDLAKELKVTVDTVTEGADEFLRAGLSAKDAIEALRASTVLSTVANMDSATSTKYLISAMNAYNLEASQLIDVVDKLSAVDVAAATSSEELGEALSVSASSARLANISLDKYLGMIATVSETTRQSASTIGNSFKTIFARLQAVKIGSLVDEEGESISDVDTVLKQYGIDLMEVTNNLNNMEALLDKLGSTWGDYTTAQKSEIATTVAGIRQRDKFLALMQNYDRVMELATISTDSAGSAMDKYSIYADSAKASINEFKAAWTELTDATLKSDLSKFIVDMARGALEFSTNLGGLTETVMLLVSGGLIAKYIALVISADTAQKAAAISANKWLLVLGLLVGAITLTTSLINAEKRKREEAFEARKKDVEASNAEVEALTALKKEYINLSSMLDRSDSQNERLLEIKQQLIDTYGMEADALDVLNGKYEDNAEAMRKAEKDALLKQIRDTEYLKTEAKQLYTKSSSVKSLLGAYGLARADERYLNEFGESEQELIKTLMEGAGGADLTEESAYMTLYSAYSALRERENRTAEESQRLSALSQVKGLADYYEAAKALVPLYERLSYLNTDVANAIDDSLFELYSFLNSSEEMQLQNIETLEATIESLLSSEYYSQFKDQVEDVIDAVEDRIQELKTTDYALKSMETELAVLKEKKELEDEELETQEKLLAVEKARADLADAQRRKVRVFRAGQGFVYESDLSSVQSAQSALESAQRSAGLTPLDKEIAEMEALIARYSELQLEQSHGGLTGLRDYFRDAENLSAFSKMSASEKSAVLERFSSESVLNNVATAFTPVVSGLKEIASNLKEGFFGILSGKYASEYRGVGAIASSGSNQSISIGNISLPSVTDADGFISELSNFAQEVKGK